MSNVCVFHPTKRESHFFIFSSSLFFFNRCFFSPKGVDGATTVAATSYLASLAGVKVFVTGGMGGVHRGAETTFDVSADLAELARTPIVVVCAGVKSILDIEKTLEVWVDMRVPRNKNDTKRYIFPTCVPNPHG